MLTVIPEVESDIAQMIPATDCSSGTVERQVAEIVEGHGQVAVLATESEGRV